MNDPSLFIGIPAYGGVDTSCVVALSKLEAELRRYSMTYCTAFISNNSLIYDARNRLARAFIESGMSHALFLDADIGFDAPAVIDMISKRKDFIVAAVPMRSINWELVQHVAQTGLTPESKHGVKFNVTLVEPIVSFDNLIEVKFAGTAFMIVTRNVIETLVQKHPDLTYDADGFAIPGIFHPMIRDRKLWGEDYSFCRRWVDQGGKIWLYPNMPVIHTGPNFFRGNFADFVGQTE